MRQEHEHSTGLVGRERRPAPLTRREDEILQLIWNGYQNRQIASRLNISVKTVEAHRATMMKKVRVHNTALLLTAAIKAGMIRVLREQR